MENEIEDILRRLAEKVTRACSIKMSDGVLVAEDWQELRNLAIEAKEILKTQGV
jgi:predicted transcriptional regulator